MKHVTAVLLAAAVLLAGGCSKAPRQPGAARPRVVSYSPALTEMLFDMGLGDHVVGVTAFCELPPGQTRTVVGDLRAVNPERILSVRPDLVLIQQKTEDFTRVTEADPRIRIEHFTIETLGDIARALERVGRLVGEDQLGTDRRKRFEDSLAQVRRQVASLPAPRVLFLTQIDPPSVPGADSFIGEMIELAGGRDVAGKYKRWTRINVERIIVAKPEVIVCCAKPGKSGQVRDYLLSLQGVPAVETGRLFVVTDRGWTIPSARLSQLAGKLAEMIHPQLLDGSADP